MCPVTRLGAQVQYTLYTYIVWSINQSQSSHNSSLLHMNVIHVYVRSEPRSSFIKGFSFLLLPGSAQHHCICNSILLSAQATTVSKGLLWWPHLMRHIIPSLSLSGHIGTSRNHPSCTLLIADLYSCLFHVFCSSFSSWLQILCTDPLPPPPHPSRPFEKAGLAFVLKMYVL